MRRVFSLQGKTHGSGRVDFCWQRKLGNYLATAGSNHTVNLFDRHGNLVEEIELPGACTGMDWDKDGGVLAIIQNKNCDVLLWDANTHKTTTLDTGLKSSLSFVAWSRTGPQLAVGSAKGDLLLYNQSTTRKVPILGKQSKKITCGSWSNDAQNLLCIGSEDRAISLCNADGDTIHQALLHGEISDIQFYIPPSGAPREGNLNDAKISIVVNKKNLFLINIKDPDNPIELAFQARYGNIVSYKWFGQGKIVIGFSSGFLVVVSTHMQQIGQELHQKQNHRTRLNDIACSEALNKAASCGDNCIKIHDLTDFGDVFAMITLEEDRGMLDRMAWSDDGQLLAISLQNGGLYAYLTKLPMVGDACGSRLAMLTSLQEITVANPLENDKKIKIKAEVEPQFVAVGPFHAACGMNNSAWFYAINEDDAESLNREPRTYLGSITSMQLNADYAAVLCDGRLQLHLIESDNADDERESRLFPDQNQTGDKITTAALTSNFCIYGTESGGLNYFLLEDWSFVNEFRHVVGIRKLFPDPSGTRLVFFDDKGDGYVYNPVNDETLEVPTLSATAAAAKWDIAAGDRGTFVVYDEDTIYTYSYIPDHVDGRRCVLVGTTKLPYGLLPLVLNNGTLLCLSQSGKTVDVLLDTHRRCNPQTVTEEFYSDCVQQNVALGRFRDAFAVATKANDADLWKLLASTVLTCLDIDAAINVYRATGDAAMVKTLRGIMHVEDYNVLAGHVSLILGKQDKAQELFLKSSEPQEALKMHRDLLNWEQAMALAEKLDTSQIPAISREYGQQLEYQGHWQEALKYYQRGLADPAADESHIRACKAGEARTILRAGDLRKGVALAQELHNRQLYRECGAILESMNQHNEAASMYERGEQFDKAASIYIRSKNWPKVGELLQNITSPKLHLQYAKAREADGSYREAAQAYELAKDSLSVIRINLDHLRNPDEAVRIVKSTGSVDGARMVAHFFKNLGDFNSAIQFLVMSKCPEEALAMAKAHNKMDVYAEVVGDGATSADYAGIASHFDDAEDHLEAGRFFLKAGEYGKALKHLLKCNESDGVHIDLAIDTIGQARQENLTNQLIDYLMGQTDGQPKDAKYLFKLYMALKQYREAARTAIIIAREEQTAGNYRNAHDVLFSMYQQLRKENIPIPNEMAQNLMILHSYILVKLHVRRSDHLKGARMLTRVANHISKFPAHVVNILTSTVIECQRSGLKNSAFSYAAMLLRPEYRPHIDAKYKKKIEQIVRKPDKTEVAEEETPCPFCDQPVPVTQLQCTGCDNLLPYCLLTGFHMVKDDWSECPECHFPCLYSEMTQLIESGDNSCPMCSANIESSLQKLDDAAVAERLARDKQLR